MAEQWLDGSRHAIVVDGGQVMAVVLARSRAQTAYVASWDAFAGD